MVNCKLLLTLVAIGCVTAAPSNVQGTGLHFAKREVVPPQCEPDCEPVQQWLAGQEFCDIYCQLDQKEYPEPPVAAKCAQCIHLPPIAVSVCYDCINRAKQQ